MDKLYSFIMRGELTKVALEKTDVISRHSHSDIIEQEYIKSLSLDLLDEEYVNTAKEMATVYAAILLCLKKYVKDLDTLRNAIMEIDPTAIEYYEKVPVPFASDGVTINFSDSQEAVYATIRNRIYSVRNAIVHSKEGEKLRYEPFKHDKELLRELPLIRAVAEEIIINSAKKLEFINFE